MNLNSAARPFLPLLAEGIREPWMLACSISAIQVVVTSINWHWDAYTGEALVDKLFV
jgi:hypothetical protein